MTRRPRNLHRLNLSADLSTVPEPVRLRHLLKRLVRAYDFRCEDLRELARDPAAEWLGEAGRQAQAPTRPAQNDAASTKLVLYHGARRRQVDPAVLTACAGAVRMAVIICRRP